MASDTRRANQQTVEENGWVNGALLQGLAKGCIYGCSKGFCFVSAADLRWPTRQDSCADTKTHKTFDSDDR